MGYKSNFILQINILFLQNIRMRSNSTNSMNHVYCGRLIFKKFPLTLSLI